MTGNDQTHEELRSFLRAMSAGLRAYADRLGGEVELNGWLHDLARTAEAIESRTHGSSPGPDGDLELA